MFFSLIQKIAQNEPEKKIPSNTANAISLVPKLEVLSSIHLDAQSLFF